MIPWESRDATVNLFWGGYKRIKRDIKPVPRTFRVGGVFRYRSGERLHGMQEVTGSIPVFSTRRKSTARKRVVFFVVTDQRRNYELRDRIQQ